MTETVAQPPVAERTPAKERLAYHDEFVGLRSRLLMGGEMLDHAKPIPQTIDDIKNRIDSKDASGVTAREKTTYRNLAKLSTDERIKYWEDRAKKDQNLSQSDAQKAAWIKDVVGIYNDPANSDYKTVFGKLNIGGINWKNFDQAAAQKLYDVYFQDSVMTPITLDDKTVYIPSSVARYVNNIVDSYITDETVEGKKMHGIDLEALKNDLPALQAFSSIFGDQYSYEILAQLIDAETKNIIEEKRNEEINATLQKEKVGNDEKARGDNLREREIELLEALQAAGAYREVAGPIPPGPDHEPPADQPQGPPSEPTDEQEEPEKSKPLPHGFKWIYEKAFDPEHPEKIREFPEPHLVGEMVSPSAIARKLKFQDKKYNRNRLDQLTVEQLAQEIATENKVLEGRLAMRGLDRPRLLRIMDGAMGAYRNFIEEKYKIKLPNIGEVAILPIWGKTAQYYNPDRTTLAFVIPTVPAIFLDMGVIEKQAMALTNKPWWQLTDTEFQTLMARYLNEIRPHETTHLSSDLAFWYLDEENNSDKHKKVDVGKLGPLVTKPIGIDEDGDIVVKRRGRGLMEAVTVELTNQWAMHLNQPLDIDAYRAERQVLHELKVLLKKDQYISDDEAFNKFVQAYFTPDGFSHLAQELSGRKYEKGADGKLQKAGVISRPHFLEVVYALMEQSDHNRTNYSLALSYIRDSLTPAQKQEILRLVDEEEIKDQKNIPSYLTLPKKTRAYLRTQLTGITPPPPTKPPAPPEPPKPPTPAKEIKSADDLTKEVLEKIAKGEAVNITMDENAVATLIPTLLPAIEKKVREMAGGIIPINLRFEKPPTVKITSPRAVAQGTIVASAFLRKTNIDVSLTMENKATTAVSFTKTVTNPPTYQDKIHAELAKSTLNTMLQSYISSEVAKKNPDLQIESVQLHFNPNNRLEVIIKGKSKKAPSGTIAPPGESDKADEDESGNGDNGDGNGDGDGGD